MHKKTQQFLKDCVRIETIEPILCGTDSSGFVLKIVSFDKGTQNKEKNKQTRKKERSEEKGRKENLNK